MKFSDRVKTSFTCKYGTFQLTVMPFGLSTAPATFQRMMNTIFFELLDLGVLVYLDDVLIYSKTVEEHKILLNKVFELL
jgi:Reverse transcriptase (RNA-dependent DNA polymerase)